VSEPTFKQMWQRVKEELRDISIPEMALLLAATLLVFLLHIIALILSPITWVYWRIADFQKGKQCHKR